MAALVAASVGCGDGKLRRYPVSGTVSVGGKPIEGVRVTLVPIGGSEKLQKERPSGVTDEIGRFELTTFVRGDGAPAGEFTVLFHAVSPTDAEQARRWAKRPKLDPKYRRPDTSGITVTIGDEATELPPFEL